jgi:hypothetical protein
MNYLTQYYKNRCDQLQEQISQINYSLRNLSEAVSTTTLSPARPSVGKGAQSMDYGTGASQGMTIAEFMSRWGQPGYDGEGLGRLLGSMVPNNNDVNAGEATSSAGNGVGAAAQRIMAGKSPTSSASASDKVGSGVGAATSAGTNNQQTVDQFLANWGQPGYDGAALGQLLGNMVPSNAPAPNAYGTVGSQTSNRRKRGM